MRLRRHTVSLLILAAVVVLLVGIVSFFRPFSGELSPTRRTWFQCVVTEGNLRAIFARGPEEPLRPATALTPLTPEPFDLRSGPEGRPTLGPRPLDDVRLFWQRALLVALPLRLRVYPRIDPTDSRFGAYEVRLDLSTFILAPLLLFVAWLLGPGRRLLAHGPGILREIRHPSDGEFLRPRSRLVRRALVAVLGLAAWVTIVLLGLSVTGSAVPGGSREWHPKFLGQRVQTIWVDSGSLGIKVSADPDTPAAFYKVRWPGFSLETNANRIFTTLTSLPPGIRLGDLSDSAAKAFLKQLQLRTSTATPVHTVRLGLWVPSVLLMLYPGMALIRGPIRRYRRRAKGQCLTCGYNLTGLIEPRCPECGTWFGLSKRVFEQLLPEPRP